MHPLITFNSSIPLWIVCSKSSFLYYRQKNFYPDIQTRERKKNTLLYRVFVLIKNITEKKKKKTNQWMNWLRAVSNFLRPFFSNNALLLLGRENSELGTNLGPIPYFIFKQFWTEKLGAFMKILRGCLSHSGPTSSYLSYSSNVKFRCALTLNTTK